MSTTPVALEAGFPPGVEVDPASESWQATYQFLRQGASQMSGLPERQKLHLEQLLPH